MKNRVNITLSNDDLALAQILCGLRGQSRSDLIGNLLMYAIYDEIDNGRITYDDVKKMVENNRK